MVDNLSKSKRSWNMGRIHSKNTTPERKVRSMLHKMGYRFRLHNDSLPCKPDIILPKYKTAIFVHGCFWHRHEGCKYAYIPKSRTAFWNRKFKENKRRDKKCLKDIISAGWDAIIVWECELRNVEELKKKLSLPCSHKVNKRF